MLVDKRWPEAGPLCAEAVLKDAYLLLQLQISMFGCRQFGDQTVVADPVPWSRVTVRALAASSFIDEASQVFVALKEVAVYARSGDDDLSAYPAVFSLQFAECLQYLGTLSGRVSAPSIQQARHAFLVALRISHR